MSQQEFQDPERANWQALTQFPGAQLLPLAEPVPQGSIHCLRMAAGTVIPVHTHPGHEYVYVLSGILETAGHCCKANTFWHTPAGTPQGPHKAITDVELITLRLGAMGVFEEASGRRQP
ncbi:MAG: cupin domain-containing protein [Cyanobacteria bacterium P01_A01_bin.70]